MTINPRTFGDVIVLDLEGKLTIDDGAAMLRDRVARLVAEGNKKLLLNLAGVPYVDSGGLGELVRCSLIANREQGTVKLVNLTQRIADLLTITKLLTVFDTFDNEDLARASFGKIQASGCRLQASGVDMTIRHVFTAAVLAAGIASPAFAQSDAPTFNKDIAPILFNNCTSCHRPGEIGPMSLLTFKDARPWAKSIASRTQNGTMPPWHADPAYGQFKNERRLSDTQKTLIAKWAAAGAPEGNAADLPPTPQYKDGWNMEPDVILSMQEDYPIPATGTVPYEYLEVPANFKEDRYITAWEIRPGDRRAVHHIIVQFRPSPATIAQMMLAPRPPAPAPGTPRPLPLFTLTPQTQIPEGQSGGRPLPPDQRPAPYPNDRPRPAGTLAPLGGYVPGTSVEYFPEGTALKLPAGYSLVFQMHYTPYGKATTDRTKIGLKFAKEPPKTALNVAAMLNAGFKIPAGAANYEVDQEMTLNRDVILYSFVPHTHVRGTGWYYEATYPDGKKEVILSVPKYDFNWQHEYVFKEPLKMPAGTKIAAKAWYNNSPSNKSNPDATKDVTWGDQTWEEMMYTSITFSVVPPAATTAAPKGQQ